MIEAIELNHSMPKLRSVNIELAKGKLIGIIGPNGAGKTSLLKILAGLITPDAGSVLLDKQSLTNINKNERALQIAYLEQHCFVHWPLSVAQLVALGRYPHRHKLENSEAIDQQIIDKVMALAGVKMLAGRVFNTLSGGERARVLLARALAVQADHLLVDEPISSLDLKYQLQIMDLLALQVKNNLSVCVVLHDLNLAAAYCDEIYLLKQGKIISRGAAEFVLTKENLKQTFNVNANITINNGNIQIYPISIYHVQ